MKLSGRMTRSTDECEMSRSCHSALFSKRGRRVAAQQTSQADDLLAADRVPLVRHGRRALLTLGERLLDFADLGLLKPADLERELLERRGRDGQRRHQLGVPVALNDLRRDGRRLETERPAGVGLDGRWQMRERADRSRQLADGDDRRARAACARRRAPAPHTRAPA